jgi:hypothetical protein
MSASAALHLQRQHLGAVVDAHRLRQRLGVGRLDQRQRQPGVAVAERLEVGDHVGRLAVRRSRRPSPTPSRLGDEIGRERQDVMRVDIRRAGEEIGELAPGHRLVGVAGAELGRLAADRRPELGARPSRVPLLMPLNRPIGHGSAAPGANLLFAVSRRSPSGTAREPEFDRQIIWIYTLGCELHGYLTCTRTRARALRCNNPG